MKLETFNRYLAVPQIILSILVCAQLYQNQNTRTEILGQLETFQTKTERTLYSIQSQLESKFNQLRGQIDEDKINNDRAFRILKERVDNLERRPAVIMNGYQGYKNSGNQNNNIQ